MPSSHRSRGSARPARSSLTVCLAAVALALVPAGAADAPAPRADDLAQVVIRGAERGAPATPWVIDLDLRDLAAPDSWEVGDPVREIPMRWYPPAGLPAAQPALDRDPLVDLQRAAQPEPGRAVEEFTVPSRNVEGLGYSGVNPPDTVGDIGPNYYIQSINTGGGADVRIWDKAIPPNVVSTIRLDTLGSGACAGGFGDPIILYDRQAGRWLLTEFSGSGNNLCVYVSQTGDPVSGGWFAYQFTMPSFPDYPKYAVWATDLNGGDGSYVVTANDGGPGVIALERGKMLVGEAATWQRVSIPRLNAFGVQAPTPADPDGPNGPPAFAPAVIMRHRDTELHGGSAPGDILEVWNFEVDWQDESNTSIALTNVEVADFDSAVCGTVFAGCFPQPSSGTTLFPIREAIMNRLQYFNHGDFETLVGNYVVDVAQNDQGGVRWFELRRTGGIGNPWTVQQEGTYSIDDDNRWMAGISMDQSQNIAVGYNVVSGSTFPALRYTGRMADDPAGVMTQPETSIIEGTGSNSSSRYGDYSAMGLDPEDDCTFWFTGMNNFTSNWRTQWASFRFDRCGCELEPSPLTVQATVPGDNLVELVWDDADLPTVIEYRILRSRSQGGPYDTVAVVEDTSPGVAGDPTPYVFQDDTVSGGTEYFYLVRASDGETCTSDPSAEVSANATGACTLEPLFDGLQAVSAPPFGVCKLDLLWGDATPECDGPVTYNIYRSSDPGFAPGAANLIASEVIGNTFQDTNVLVDGQVYFYVVRAVDVSNGSEEKNSIRLSGAPQGVDGACTTGSSCAENPFVDVEPEGPLTVCQGDGPTLEALLSSGEGPFLYQWYENGEPIPGAVGPTLLTENLGDNVYNVRVRSESCPDEVFDGLDTSIKRVNTPFFDGVQTAVNPKSSTCTIDLAWDPATTVCDGPVRYFVYRDTEPNVQAVPSNLVASGIPGTTFSDTVGLVNEEIYYYLVRSQDASTGQTETNTTVVSAAPDGPMDGVNQVSLEEFNDAADFSQWTVGIGPGAHSCGEWALESASGTRPSGGSGSYAYTYSTCAQIAPRTSSSLDSPLIDMSFTDMLGAELKANIRYDHVNGDDTTIEVWDGVQWVVVWNDPNADFNGLITLDVLPWAQGNAEFRVRFNYQNANADGFFSVDNVRLEADLFRPCATGLAGPPPAPDGRFGSTPLLSEALALDGSSIRVTWDASCGAAGYNLLWGDLANVGSYGVAGSECSVGAGTFDWNAVPAGDLYWIVVGSDGAGIESSWGVDGGGAERNGSAASGTCGATVKDVSGTCP